MAVTHTIDGDDIGTVFLSGTVAGDRPIELVGMAELGQVGSSQLVIDDVSGTLVTVGWKQYEVNEDLCASPLLHRGSVGTRRFRRGSGRTGASRFIEMSVLDDNDLLTRYVIRGGGNRPRESVGDRIDWILNSTYLSGLVIDDGCVVYPDTIMDANDYRYTSKPSDVIGDCAVRVGFEFFVYPGETASAAALFFADPASDLYTSTILLSNVWADIDWDTTFPSSLEAALTRDPGDVWSNVLVNYEGSRVMRTRAATASAYTTRQTVAPTSSIKKRAQAIAQGDQYLSLHRLEEDEVEDTVLITASRVGLLREGMRVQARYSHFAAEGYGIHTWFRVKERRTRSVVSPGGIPEAPDEPLYELGLRLVPLPCVATEESITLVQAKSQYAPNTSVGFDSPTTPGNLLVWVIGNRDEISLGPIGHPPPDGWAEAPYDGSNEPPWVISAQNPGRKGNASLWYKVAEVGDSTWPCDNQSANILAEFSGESIGVTPILSASNEVSGVASASISLTSGVPGRAALVVAALITRLSTEEGDFIEDAGIHTVPAAGAGPQTTIGGGGRPLLLWTVSTDGSAVTFSGTQDGPSKDGFATYGMRIAAFEACPA